MTHPLAPHAAIALAAYLLPACGSTSNEPTDAGQRDAASARDTSADEAGDGAREGSSGTGSLKSHLSSLGYTTLAGVFGPVDLATCCAAGASCFNSNPASPYFSFFLPPLPGQTAKNPGTLGGGDAGASGLSSAWRLEEGEAIVYVGPTPPRASYFGFTPYLFDRDVGGQRKTLFASLSATTNNLAFQVEGGGSVYDAPTVVIAAADRRTSDDVATALTRAGHDPRSFNVVVLDAKVSHFGIDESADTFTVLFRVGEFASSTAKEGAAWVEGPHGTLLRVTPKREPTPDPLPPVVRTERTSPTERTPSLEASVAALKAAIVARYASMTSSSLTVTDTPADAATCLSKDLSCEGRNPDTNYPRSTIGRWPADDKTFYVVYGINHAATGKTQFSSFDVLSFDHLVGVAGMTSAQYAGSASAFVPKDPNVESLYACRVGTSCAGVPPGQCCLAVPDTACPTGLSPGGVFAFSFRTCLDPTSDTAPDPATLMPEGVLVLTSP